ncbi:MAG: TrkA family potassium uptake protein [Planctomycetes bacterium]|nr:TrkA family potassium uptake protein [Planctomycetota bacterium]
MRSKKRILSAWLVYLRKPIRQFLPLFVFAILTVLAGGVAFYALYDRPLRFSESLWVTFALLTGEPVKEWPSHWLLEVLQYVLPIIGLVLVLDGLVRFSYYAFRRDEMSPEWVKAMATTLQNHVILFGLGKVGLRVLQQLVALKQEAIVIEKDPNCPNFAYARKHGVPIRVGTAREEGILDDVNVTGARSVICCTDDDLANLELAIDARKAKPDIRVVLRMYDQELAEKIRDSLNIHLAFSTAMLSAPLFATASLDPCVINSFYIDERLLVVARITPEKGTKLAGKTIAELVRGFQLVVISQKRGEGAVFHPPLENTIEPGDILTLECDPMTLREIHALNRA